MAVRTETITLGELLDRCFTFNEAESDAVDKYYDVRDDIVVIFEGEETSDRVMVDYITYEADCYLIQGVAGIESVWQGQESDTVHVSVWRQA